MAVGLRPEQAQRLRAQTPGRAVGSGSSKDLAGLQEMGVSTVLCLRGPRQRPASPRLQALAGRCSGGARLGGSAPALGTLALGAK